MSIEQRRTSQQFDRSSRETERDQNYRDERHVWHALEQPTPGKADPSRDHQGEHQRNRNIEEQRRHHGRRLSTAKRAHERANLHREQNQTSDRDKKIWRSGRDGGGSGRPFIPATIAAAISRVWSANMLETFVSTTTALFCSGISTIAPR